MVGPATFQLACVLLAGVHSPLHTSTRVTALRGHADTLAFYDDAWHAHADPSTVPPHAVHSAATIKEDSLPSSSSPGTSTTEWAVRAPLTFEYRVIEAPRLFHPDNDALLFGHLAPGSAARARAREQRQRRLVVIDQTVDELFGDGLRAYLEARRVDHQIVALPMLEENKDVDLVLQVAEAMKRFELARRDEPVIAIGGGVCLDVVGLAATLFRRGTPYIRVPTTTLSYVDASVGAKSGVNFMGSKNRLGAYVPPAAALLDPSFLRTESARGVSSGLAEMAKMALVKSPELFELLEAHAERLVAHRFQPLSARDGVPGRVLGLSVRLMLDELAPNLWEASLDRLVDFGHVLGQELELRTLGTEHELTHGESVGVDMAFMTVLAAVRAQISEAQRDRILAMLRRCAIPVYSAMVDEALVLSAMVERRAQSMGQRLPLPVGVGKARIFNDVSEDELLEAHRAWTDLCCTRPPPATPATRR